MTKQGVERSPTRSQSSVVSVASVAKPCRSTFSNFLDCGRAGSMMGGVTMGEATGDGCSTCGFFGLVSESGRFMGGGKET